jgi:hypothetical protein
VRLSHRARKKAPIKILLTRLPVFDVKRKTEKNNSRKRTRVNRVSLKVNCISGLQMDHKIMACGKFFLKILFLLKIIMPRTGSNLR